MNIEKLIEAAKLYGIDAADALTALLAENERLQKMYQEEKVVCHETQLELERMKKIMREDEVMVAPSEYPGSQKMEYSEVMRSEGGIVK